MLFRSARHLYLLPSFVSPSFVVNGLYFAVSRETRGWNKLQERLSKDGSQLVKNFHRLKLLAADGKIYLTDFADGETLLRLVQVVRSPRLSAG